MAKPERKKLTELETIGVSLVKRGANKRKFAIAKSEEKMDEREIIEAVLETEVDEEAKIAEIFKAALSPRAMAAVKGALRLLSSYKEELPDDVMPKLAALAGYPEPEPKVAQDDKKEEVEKMSKLGDFLASEAEKKGLTTMQLARAAGVSENTVTQIMRGEIAKPPMNRLQGFARALKVPMARLEALLPKEEKDKTMKTDDFENLPPEVKAQVEALWKDREEQVELRKKLESDLAEEREARLSKEYLEKAEKQFSHVPGETTEIAYILKSLHCIDPALEARIEAQFKSTEAALSHSALLEEAGTPGTQASGGDIWAKIEQAADSIVKKSAGTTTKSSAISDFLSTEAGKAMYAEYLDNNPSQTA